MLSQPQIQRYSAEAGLRDIMIAEKEVVLTYLLQLLAVRAEKIRACYQRNKARDIYDLGMFAKTPLNQALIRRLVVLKLWQARDSFDPERLMKKFEDGKSFDWDDLNQLVRRTLNVDREKITVDCIEGYRFLLDLTEDERRLAADPYQRQSELWQALRASMPIGTSLHC